MSDSLIGQPYGYTFEVLQDKKVKIVEPQLDDAEEEGNASLGTRESTELT
jgi:hypothetical protein